MTTTDTSTTDNTTNSLDDYVIILKKELWLKKNVWEFELSFLEGKALLDLKYLIIKFLKKTQVSYMLDIYKFRWKEEIIHNKIDWINDIINAIDSLENCFKKYEEEKEK